MSVWNSIGGALRGAVFAPGLVLGLGMWRKNGASRGIRAIAWSLLPLGAYLTSAIGLLGNLVNSVVKFAGAFIFSPKTYVGVIVVAISAVLFLVSGGIPLVSGRKRRQ